MKKILFFIFVIFLHTNVNAQGPFHYYELYYNCYKHHHSVIQIVDCGKFERELQIKKYKISNTMYGDKFDILAQKIADDFYEGKYSHEKAKENLLDAIIAERDKIEKVTQKRKIENNSRNETNKNLRVNQSRLDYINNIAASCPNQQTTAQYLAGICPKNNYGIRGQSKAQNSPKAQTQCNFLNQKTDGANTVCSYSCRGMPYSTIQQSNYCPMWIYK